MIDNLDLNPSFTVFMLFVNFKIIFSKLTKQIKFSILWQNSILNLNEPKKLDKNIYDKSENYS